MAELPEGFVPLEQRGARTPPPPPEGFTILGQEKDEQEDRDQTTVEQIDNVIRSVAQGMSFGFSDEFAAYMGSVTGFPEAPSGQGDYTSRLAAERAREAEIPFSTRIPGEIAGGTVTTLLAAPAMAPTRIPQMLMRLPGWARAGALGAGFGSAYGFGNGEGGLKSRAEDAMVSGFFGAMLGPPLYLAGRGLEQTGRAIGRAISQRFNPRQAAERTLSRALAADQRTIGGAEARLRTLGPEATLADVAGPNVRGLVRAASAKPGAARISVETTLAGRARREASRIAAAVRRGLDPQDYFAAEEAYLGNMRNVAGPLYKQAYQAYPRLVSPRLKGILSSTTGRKALREVAAMLKDEVAAGSSDDVTRETLEEITKALSSPDEFQGMSLRAWDQLKRGFDALLDRPAYRNELTRRLNMRGKAVDQLRRGLLGELDKATGGIDSIYSQARRVYAGEAESLGALASGRDLFKTDPEVIAKTLDGLSDAGRESYRAGAARAIKDIVDRTRDVSSIAIKIFGNTRQRAQLRAMFPTTRSYREFARSLAAEIVFNDTRNAVLSGSRTAPMFAELEAARRGAGAFGAIVASEPNLGGILGGHALVRSQFGRRIMEGIVGPENPRYYQELSRMLLSNNPADNHAVLQHLRTIPIDDAAGRLAKMLLVAAGVGAKEIEK